MVYKYHEHDSLLERNNEQDLSEAEKADAWAAYEQDATLRNNLSNMGTYNANFNMNPGTYDNFASSYNALMGATLGSSYGTNASASLMAAAYLNQITPSTAFASPEYQELMRMYNDTFPYSNYPGYPTASGMYNSALMSSPPPPSITPTSATSPGQSLLNYNAMNSRNMLNTNNNFLSSLVQAQSPSTSKNYASSYASSMQMNPYLSPYATGNSGGGRIPAQVSSPLTSTSKSLANSTSSMYDPSVFNYLQQNSLLFGGPATTTTSSATSALNSVANARSSNSSSPGSNSSSRQGPNAKRNPMLSKELSMMPTRTPFFDSLNLPSIQTSVITKSPVNLTTTTTASASTTAAASGDSASKDGQRLVSPEPHLIVKNVNAINQAIG